MQNKIHRFFIFVSFFVVLSAHGQIFECTERGNKIFTDRPPITKLSSPISTISNLQQVSFYEQGSQNSMYDIGMLNEHSETAISKNNKITRSSRITVLSPSNQQSIWRLPITLSLDINPPLSEGMRIQLYIDGEVYGKSTTSCQFQIEKVSKGPHTAQAYLVDNTNKNIETSQQITFYVK